MVTEILVREISQNEVEISLGKEIFFLTYSERLDTTVVVNIFDEFIGEIREFKRATLQELKDIKKDVRALNKKKSKKVDSKKSLEVLDKKS